MLLPRALTLVSFSALLLLGCTTDNPDATLDAGGGTPADLSGVLNPDGYSAPDLASVDPKVAIAEQCVKLATTICDQLAKCSAFELQYYYGDKATCVERKQLLCAPYVELKGSSWTLDRLRACTAGYAGGTCNDLLSPEGPMACRPQPGALADSAACADSNQCKSAFCSVGLSGCGTCVQAGKVGDACGTQKPCVVGASCINAKCLAPGAKGDACGGGKAAGCQVGLYCNANVCTPTLGVGSACTPGAAFGECDTLAGLHCDTRTAKCAAYKLADAGQACGVTGADYTLCSASGTCGGTMVASKCIAAPMDNAACGNATPDNLSCMTPANCVSSACHVFDPATCK